MSIKVVDDLQRSHAPVEWQGEAQGRRLIEAYAWRDSTDERPFRLNGKRERRLISVKAKFLTQ